MHRMRRQFACGGFTESTGIKGDQVEWAMAWDGVESRIRCVCVCERESLLNLPAFLAASSEVDRHYGA